jgi:hypothetical protein
VAKRTWTLDSRDFSTDDEFRQAVVTELAAFENIGHRIGLALIASPIRERTGRDFVTTGWAFHTETVPTARETRAPEPQAEVIPLDSKGRPDPLLSELGTAEEVAIPAVEGASF